MADSFHPNLPHDAAPGHPGGFDTALRLPAGAHRGAVSSGAPPDLGSGRVLRLRPPAGRHAVSLPKGHQRFSLVLLMAGRARLTQRGRACELDPEALTVVDGSHPFLVETEGVVDKLVIELPRAAVLSRHPALERCTAVRFSGRAEHRVVRDFALSLATAEQGDAGGRGAFFAAAIELLGVLDGATGTRRGAHRHRAMAEIRLSLSDPALSAAAVAHRIGLSRRQLDAVFSRTGLSVTEEIWAQRLGLAARLLAGSAASQRTIIDIALSCGFSEPAHFSRAFKRRFGVTPSMWRGQAQAP